MNETFRVKTDGFHAELFRPRQDKYPGKALICFSGSDGDFGLAQALSVAPMSVMCQGFSKGKGIKVMPGSSWSFHGEEVPYQSFGVEKFPYGQVLRKSLKAREVTMYDLYLPMVERPDPAAVIRVERITGPVLLISSKLDTMWPSEPAAKRIMERLRAHDFPYSYQRLSYDYGSHLFVPLDLPLAKFFRSDRGRNRELSRKARMDSLKKTLEFVSKWQGRAEQ